MAPPAAVLPLDAEPEVDPELAADLGLALLPDFGLAEGFDDDFDDDLDVGLERGLAAAGFDRLGLTPSGLGVREGVLLGVLPAIMMTIIRAIKTKNDHAMAQSEKYDRKSSSQCPSLADISVVYAQDHIRATMQTGIMHTQSTALTLTT